MADEKGTQVVFKGKDGELSANVEIAVADVKKYLCPKASDSELYMFVNIARSQGLNPFNREIHFVPFKDRHSIVVGYEVYLKRMEASGLCEGWKVEVREAGTDNEEYVFITWRKGWREPFEWAIKTNRFVKKYSGSPWETMPEHMKRKTAISQGIRMAYADVISGLPYSHEETVSMGTEVLDAEMEVPQADAPEVGKGEISLEDLTPAEVPVDKPAPIVEKLKRDLNGEDVPGMPDEDAVSVDNREVINQLKALYGKGLVLRDDLSAAINLCDYDAMVDPANIRDNIKSNKATDWKNGIGRLLAWLERAAK